MRRHRDHILRFLLLVVLMAAGTVIYAGNSMEYCGGAGKIIVHRDSILAKGMSLPIEKLTYTGYKLLEQKRYDEALTYYAMAVSKGEEKLKGNNLREYAKALNNIGYIYLFFKNDPERAYPYLLRARKIVEEAKEYDILAGVLDNIAKVYDDFGDSAKAIELYNLAMRYAAGKHTDISRVMQLMVFNDLANSAVANDMVAEIEPSLKIFDKLPLYDIPMGRYSKAMCKGLQIMRRGDLRTATSLMLDAGNFIDANQDSIRYVVDHALTLANLYNKRHLTDSARMSLDRALQLAVASNMDDRLSHIYRGLGVVAQTHGDSITAQRMWLRAYEENEKLHSGRVFNNIKIAETNAEVDNLNLMIAEERMRHAHRLTVIWILSVASALVVILLLYILQRNRRLSRSHHDLVERHKASVKAEEINARIRKEYEETISMLKSRLESMPEEEIGETTGKRIQLPVDEEERLRIIGAVGEVFAESHQIFDNAFSITQLADIVGTKPRYLSTLLNESLDKSFSDLLAEARVKNACSMLLSPEFKKTLTIEAIAEKVGYKSRTHFTSVFKKITGVTPLQYIAASK